jgi:hypothetical protein
VELIEKARKENLILKLPSHASHVLQPMNLGVYWPLELNWDEAIIKWQRKNHPLAQKFQFGVIIWCDLRVRLLGKYACNKSVTGHHDDDKYTPAAGTIYHRQKI